MAPRPIFGSPISPKQSLQRVSGQLSDWFDQRHVSSSSVELGAMAADLPDLKLSYQRDRRLFSRTLQLVVEASIPGAGPSRDAIIIMRSRRLRRRWELDWGSPTPAGQEALLDRFARAGLVEGARTMTNVRELVVSWSRARRAWRLRLLTLAGALIGTSPGSLITVPLEPEDVAGLLQILRGFRAAVAEGATGS